MAHAPQGRPVVSQAFMAPMKASSPAAWLEYSFQPCLSVLLANCTNGHSLAVNFEFRSTSIPIVLLVLATVATGIGFVTGSLGYMGAQGIYGEQLSVSAALLSWLFPPLTALTIAIFVATPRGPAKLLAGACMFALLAFVMVVGRRIIVYTAMEALLALRLTGYRLKGSFFKKTLILLTLAGFVAVGVTVFMLIRLAGSENPNDPSALSLAHRVADGDELGQRWHCSESCYRSESKQCPKENVRVRLLRRCFGR